ncbi:MAG: hypothetical protein QM813_20215 [Verrucomicrobiota bacterium]
MNFVQHSINWVRGEGLEMVLISAAGIVLIASGIGFWKLGATPLAKAMLWPLVVIGLAYAAIGISGYVSNQRRIPEFERAYRGDAPAFISAEKTRVEGFQYMYKITNVVAPVCFALATGLFWFTLNAHARAVGMALVIFGVLGFLIDSFSKERADIYYAKILEASASSRPTQQ